ncbi:MAG: hypothetical protein COU83_02640 [Candidatus Portnoybacteria bacterium CG10_big_fil_rev_8_21_14_0_10_40_22]|uniref:Heat-inducible transcription repressor HrcA n=1 Tax=Candidatus Portnoybacteria bacterium CG10_big_fil_rev_8_21_14_0_10_40_22 TaxID=1974814 RepID=A0A2M8KFI7_9BACT|nr:MAG: hypothetical protein AUJ33_00915 [Parcubacteria group bacterium CG1_02_40_25]PJE58667.1 MAG: hypothetical protein COU83_02640 [Candidatus Portnoybacteria bacterium CG10_big_fil_rev_8_21_14_0_10_40_22]
MTTRQKQILTALIDEYIETARPVASQILAKKFGLSSATLRLELANLMEQGLVARPHISSGRVPTDKAYRWYIKNLHQVSEIAEPEKEYLNKQIQGGQDDRQLTQSLVRALAQMTNNLSFSLVDDDFFESGLSQLLHQPEFTDYELVLGVSQIFDTADQIMANLMRDFTDIDNDVNIFIGSEGPMRRLPYYSLLSSRYQLPTGQQGVVAMLGPKRMDYQRNIALLNYASQLLNSVNELTS